MDYKKAGVDIEAGYKSVELMKKHVAATMRPEVLGGLGGFSGAFSLSKIKEMEAKLTEYEDKWYAKFSKMETALAKMQSNASAVTSLLGG